MMSTKHISDSAGSGPSIDRFDQVVQMFADLKQEIAELRGFLTDRRKPQYTVDEFAALIGRSAYTIRRWISEGRIQAIRVEGTGPRGRLLIPNSALESLIASARGARVPSVAIDVERCL